VAGGRDYDRGKFEELIVYIARRLGPEAALGRVKLAKLLMHSDFESFRRYGQSVWRNLAFAHAEADPPPEGEGSLARAPRSGVPEDA
jgi:hypothetical protein